MSQRDFSRRSGPILQREFAAAVTVGVSAAVAITGLILLLTDDDAD